ncbi:MAG: metallophosphoesterase family protein [Phyllobacterium sp.]
MMSYPDPRRGDMEDDASSPKSKSMLALAGGMLIEISLPKLIIAWTFLLVIPGLLLGLAPMVATAWLNSVSGRITSPFAGLWTALILAALGLFAWYGGRALLRVVERSFWSLTSVVVQPAYATCREGLRHLVEKILPRTASQISRRATLRAASAIVAGLLVCFVAGSIFLAVRPYAELFGDIREIESFRKLVVTALANSTLVICGYLALGALIWGLADATMDQPSDLTAFHTIANTDRSWRIAHLSDIHIVGEHYGFRIESGRYGPRGNGRLRKVFERLEALDAAHPLDVILITGDMTDAGRSAEWAELSDILADYPRFAGRVLMLPGNHDLNIVDRANPARMDLPTSPNRKFRQIRTLNALGKVQGSRVRMVDDKNRKIGGSLDEFLAPNLAGFERFLDAARPRLYTKLGEIWNAAFPMVCPPETEDGLGFILLNSNADTHFSFTNALGMISADQLHRLEIATAQYPNACWIIGLHHHAVEYPQAAKALSERIGTALINGNWFIRQLKPLAGRAVLMHGHRHIDWIGKCADLLIVSAPSPVMEATNDQPTCFYIHTAVRTNDGQLKLAKPERIEMDGDTDTMAVGGEPVRIAPSP